MVRGAANRILMAVALLTAATIFNTSRANAEAPQPILAATDLSALLDIGGLAISPDGRLAAFQIREADAETNTYRLAWYVTSTAGGDVRRLTDGGEPIRPLSMGRQGGDIVVYPALWSPDARWIAYLRHDTGQTQIWRTWIRSGRSERLTRNEGNVSHAILSLDGRKLLYQVDLSLRQIADELAIEARTGFLFDERTFPGYGHHPLLPRGDGAPTQRIWAYDLASGRESPATATEREEFGASTPPLSRAGLHPQRAVLGPASAWTEALDPQRQGGLAPLTIVARLNGARERIVCGAEQCTGQMIRAMWWRSSEELIFARAEGFRNHETALYGWRVEENEVRLILRTSDRLVGRFDLEWSCGIGGGRLVCLHETPSYPRRLAAVDLDSGRVETLFDPNPQFARFDIGASPEMMEIQAASGVEAFGYLVTPPDFDGGDRLPLVIVTYRCGGFLRGGIGDEYPVFPFAAAGMAVLCVDAPTYDFERLTTMTWPEYQIWLRGPGDQEKRRMQEVIEAAISSLDRRGLIDPDRVGLTGLSFGAEAVHYGLFNMPRLAAAIASGGEVGPISSVLYGRTTSLRAWGLDAPESERWGDLSVTMNAEKVRAPLLLNVADTEMLSSTAIVRALQRAGRSVEMYIYPDEYHTKWHPANLDWIRRMNVAWMQFWLLDMEGAGSDFAEHYDRWRALRRAQTDVRSSATPEAASSF